MTKKRPWSAIKASLEAKAASGSLKDPLPWADTKTCPGTGKPAEPRPWSEISADVKVYRKPTLYAKPLPSVFLSAGMMADSKHMLWMLERLRTLYPKAFTYNDMPRSLSRWVWFANILITDDEGRFALDGYNLMYTLMIKPFTTLASAEKSALDTPEAPFEERAG